MDTIARARDSACHGQWTNWYRGETRGLFEQSLWTLKPHWHAEDARACAALARQCAGSTAPLHAQALVPDAFEVSRDVCPLFAPVATWPATHGSNQAGRVWLCGVVLDAPAEAQPAVRIGAFSAALPSTGEGRRRIFCVAVPHEQLHAGENRVEFSVNGPADNKSLGYAAANLFFTFDPAISHE